MSKRLDQPMLRNIRFIKLPENYRCMDVRLPLQHSYTDDTSPESSSCYKYLNTERKIQIESSKTHTHTHKDRDI